MLIIGDIADEEKCMEAYNALRNEISRFVDITDNEFEKVIPFFRKEHIRKNRELVGIGDADRDLAFIVKGSLRSFTIDENGRERVYKIAFEGDWIGAPISFSEGVPSIYVIEANEPTEVLLISYQERDNIYFTVPVMERFFRKLVDGYLTYAIRRFTSVTTESAEVRYLKLLQQQPEILQRVPLQTVASYLSITPESLSRIRHNVVNEGKLLVY